MKNEESEQRHYKKQQEVKQKLLEKDEKHEEKRKYAQDLYQKQMEELQL